MAMAKNLDGIKKLNPEEIKKNRKIVLSYIGEKDKNPELIKEPKTTSRIASVFNKVDGIKLNRIFSTKPKVKNMPEKPAPVRDNLVSKQEIINAERGRQEKIEREELAKKEIAEQARREAEEKAKAEEARKRREKLRLEEKKKEERIIIKENKRLEKIKRQKAIKLFKKNLNNELGEFFSVTKQNLIYGILYLFTFLIIGYAVFCLLVLRFKTDDNIAVEMARILPVPAVITGQGIINYNDFCDIRNNYTNLNSAEKKNNLVKWVILKNLTKKYGLPANSSSQALGLAFAADEDFNQVGLSRINKINQLLKNVDGLEQLSKYADEYSDVIYYNSESAAEKFGQAIFNLNVNQISGIIFSDSGYYIAQIIDNKNGQLGVKHLFVGAKTLDQYVGEKLTKIKIFILAN